MLYAAILIVLLIPTITMIWVYDRFEAFMAAFEERERRRNSDRPESSIARFAQDTSKEYDCVLGVRAGTLKIGRFRSQPISEQGIQARRLRSRSIVRWQFPSASQIFKRAAERRRALVSLFKRLWQKWRDFEKQRATQREPLKINEPTFGPLCLEVSQGSLSVVIRRRVDADSLQDAEAYLRQA